MAKNRSAVDLTVWLKGSMYSWKWTRMEGCIFRDIERCLDDGFYTRKDGWRSLRGSPTTTENKNAWQVYV